MDTSTYPADDMARYVALWRRSQQQLAARHARLARQARATATRLAAHLRLQYGVRRVILFGSLARGGFVEGSDIDLAVEGLSRADFLRALGELNSMTRFWVDIKPLEDLEPRFRERVLSTGEDI